jgi:arabinofuranosyltransferase
MCQYLQMTKVKRYVITLIPVVIVLIGGWQYRWVSEDAYIDFRVVHNLLGGLGPVFNPGERVEVYTDPLWVAILAVFSGLFRFLSIQWWSVILGLTFTGGGFWFGGLATASLASRHSERDVVPIGLLCISVVGGVWMFVTSGLETGLIFGWLGLSWWLIVRALMHSNRGIYLTAIVVSLGFTIRPDMALFTLTEGAALFVLLSRNSTSAEGVGARRYISLATALIGIPLLSELLRVAYFGLLVSNSALAKSASSVWLSQGEAYFWNFVRPYWLWIPFLILAAVTGVRMRRWWSIGIRLDLVVLLAPVVGGVFNIAYVVRVGGDFMHARMMLPGFFAIFMIFWFEEPSKIRSWLPVVATVMWSLTCLCFLRFTIVSIGANRIANERTIYIAASGNAHPITPSNYRNDLWEKEGHVLERVAASLSPSKKIMTWAPTMMALQFVPARSHLPELYYVGYPDIGLMGLAVGDKVYVFDELSLANPIGSHFVLLVRTRPGHEKAVSLAWMDARFGISGVTPAPTLTSAREIAAARAALNCEPLSGYLRSIEGPLTVGRVVSNFEHAFEWTSMSFSSNPIRAEQQLCG